MRIFTYNILTTSTNFANKTLKLLFFKTLSPRGVAVAKAAALTILFFVFSLQTRATTMSKRKLKEAESRNGGITKKLKDIPFSPVVQTNKQRTMVFSNRGVSLSQKHLMNDIRTLLPHSKRESKFDTGRHIKEINELCHMSGCNNCVYFEKQNNKLFLWVARVPYGPSAKFYVSDSMYALFAFIKCC